jgi:hypothetical protein
MVQRNVTFLTNKPTSHGIVRADFLSHFRHHIDCVNNVRDSHFKHKYIVAYSYYVYCDHITQVVRVSGAMAIRGHASVETAPTQHHVVNV